jgi:hypothetical protein
MRASGDSIALNPHAAAGVDEPSGSLTVAWVYTANRRWAHPGPRR